MEAQRSKNNSPTESFIEQPPKPVPQQQPATKPTPQQQEHFGFRGGKRPSPEKEEIQRPTTSQMQIAGRFGSNDRPTTSQMGFNGRGPLRAPEQSPPVQRDISPPTRIPAVQNQPQPNERAQPAFESQSPVNKNPAPQQPNFPPFDRPTTSQTSMQFGQRKRIGGGVPGMPNPGSQNVDRPTTSQNVLGGGRPTTSQQQLLSGGRPTTSQMQMDRGGRAQSVQDVPKATVPSITSAQMPQPQASSIDNSRNAMQSQGGSRALSAGRPITSSQLPQNQFPGASAKITVAPTQASKDIIMEETEPEIEIDQNSQEGQVYRDLASYAPTQEPSIERNTATAFDELSQTLSTNAILMAQNSIQRNEVCYDVTANAIYLAQDSLSRRDFERDKQKIREEQEQRIRIEKEKARKLEEDRLAREAQWIAERERKEREARERWEKEEKGKYEQEQYMKQEQERKERLRLVQRAEELEGLSRVLANEAMEQALESVDRMEVQLSHYKEEIVTKKIGNLPLDMTQKAIADALESIRRLDERIEAKKATDQQLFNQGNYQDHIQAPSFISNRPQSPFPQQEDLENLEAPEYEEVKEYNPFTNNNNADEYGGGDQLYTYEPDHFSQRYDSDRGGAARQEQRRSNYLGNNNNYQEFQDEQAQPMFEDRYQENNNSDSNVYFGHQEIPAIEQQQSPVHQLNPTAGGGYQVLIQSMESQQQRYQYVHPVDGIPSSERSNEHHHYANASPVQNFVIQPPQMRGEAAYYPSGDGESAAEQSPISYQQMQFNVAPREDDNRRSMEKPDYGQQSSSDKYQDIVPSNTAAINPYDIPTDSKSEAEGNQDGYQYAVMSKVGDGNARESLKYDSESANEQQYQLTPNLNGGQQQSYDGEIDPQNSDQMAVIQHDLQQQQLYMELQMMERQVVRDMHEQSTSFVHRQQEQLEQEGVDPLEQSEVPAFPDPTNFLFNRYLVDTQPEVYYRPHDDELSPRTRFFLQNKSNPQYALYSKESEGEDLQSVRPSLPPPPIPIGGGQSSHKPALSLNQMMQMRQQQAFNYPPTQNPSTYTHSAFQIGRNSQVLDSADDRNAARLDLRQQETINNGGESTEDEQKVFKKKLADIDRITSQYEQVQKAAEDARAFHEERHVEDMTDFYLKNFKMTEAVLHDKSEIIRKSKEHLNIGQQENEYRQGGAMFNMTDEQRRLYQPQVPSHRPSELKNPQPDDGSNAKPRFMRNSEESKIHPGQSGAKQDRMQMRMTHKIEAERKRQHDSVLYSQHRGRANVTSHQMFTEDVGGFLNIADPLSSIEEGDGGKRSSYRSGNSYPDVRSPVGPPLTQHTIQATPSQQILPEIGNRPQSGLKLIRQMTRDNSLSRPSEAPVPQLQTGPSQQSKLKHPLPPLPTKNMNMPQYESRNVQDPFQNSRAQQEYYTQQVPQGQYPPRGSNPYQTQQQLPPIKPQQTYESDSQASIINIFNDDTTFGDTRGLQQHQQRIQDQMVLIPTGSTDRGSNLFERVPSQKPQSSKNDPFAIRSQLREKLYETSQMMRVDNENLLQKVQHMAQGITFIRPTSYDQANSLPPIIDIAQRQGTGSVETPKEEIKEGNPAVRGSITAIQMVEGMTDSEFNRNYNRQASQNARMQFPVEYPAMVANIHRQQSETYGNVDYIRDVVNQRMTLQSVQSVVLPPIQGGTIAVNSQQYPPLQTQNSRGSAGSQRLLDYLREENKVANKISAAQIEESKQSSKPVPSPQHESPRRKTNTDMNSRTATQEPGYHYSSHNEDEESKNRDDHTPATFALPRIVEHTVETPRNVFQLPQLSTSINSRDELFNQHQQRPFSSGEIVSDQRQQHSFNIAHSSGVSAHGGNNQNEDRGLETSNNNINNNFIPAGNGEGGRSYSNQERSPLNMR